MNIAKQLAAAAFVSVAGVGAAAAQSTDNTIQLCTGGEAGNYTFSGNAMKRVISGAQIEVVHTAGSWENIQKLQDGSCDAAIAQEDAIIVASRTTNLPLVSLVDLYKESFHLVCGKNSGVDELKDLMGSKKKVALGAAGSGPWVTWRNIVEADERYKGVVTTPDTGLLAMTQVQQGTLDCSLQISGVKSASLNDTDARFGKDTVLVEVRDGDVTAINNMTGNAPLYTKTTIEEGTYKNWTPSATFSNNSVDTISVFAKVVARNDLPASQLNALIMAAQDSLPAIHNKVGYEPN